LGQLRDASYDDKEAVVEKLSQSGHPSVRPVLQALLDERLYYRNSDQKIFISKSAEGDPLNLIDPLTLKDAGSASADSMTQIGTNNALRHSVRLTLARYSLSSPSASVRLDAAREILTSLDDATIALLRERLPVEKNSAVKKEIATGLALADLGSADASLRLSAIATLKESVSQEVRNRLEQLTGKNADGSFTEPDERVRHAAAAAIQTIDGWRTFYADIQILFFGLSLGSVLVLIATGLAITFGVMGVINMAHGELMMLGAYTTYVVQTIMPGHIALSILVSIPAAFMVSGLAGIAMERTIIKYLYGRPLETLLATFGVSLILQQGVRSIFTALNRSVQTPDFMSGSLRLNDALEITYNRLYIVIFTLLVFALLLLILKRTRIGLDIRAVSQNRAMAKAMGIRTEWVDAMTFGLGSGIAGVAGVALSQLTNVGPNLGQSYIIDSFMVVVFGGVGNLWGSLVGGMSMGVVNQLLEPYAGAVLAKILVLVALILFIQARPRGLFPQVGRAAEDK
jgi:urea transport system permease protein